MKIDRSKVKKGTSEVPDDCSRVINFLKVCSEEELLNELQQINVWYYGKCELYHWIDVIDRFDGILADVAKPVDGKKWIFEFDVLEENHKNGSMKKKLVFHVLKFTALLIEHSYARHLYNSVEHLITLLDCIDGNVILSVLNLIFVFSKRSNYLSRLPNDKKKLLQEKLIDLAQTWGGLEAGCALEQCCSQDMPLGAGNVYYEYYIPEDSVSSNQSQTKTSSNRYCIDLKNIHQMASNAGLIMENLIKSKKLPENIQISFYHRLRLAHAMASHEERLQYVQARLHALSILVYSNATAHVNILVYDGLIEEIVNTLKFSDDDFKLAEVKASCLKTLTAIIHLDRNPRLQAIIDSTEATSYHGFLPSLVRKCILHMTDSEYESFPQHLATSLFSFLYHLASYEPGCEALVASGLIESLLKVVLWPGQDDHITFVTRAVRVIDLITNVDMGAFQTHNGLAALVGRLEREVKLCSKFHGPALSPELPIPVDEGSSVGPSTSLKNDDDKDVEMKEVPNSKEKVAVKQCLPQRAALLKSILNFLKKAIPNPAFTDNTRSLMDENLQYSLQLIISNSEYYGALLFLLATDVITVFIFHEPSLLSTLQDSGLTWVVLKALIIKDVPATRENLASLPNTLSALCLNTRGLEAFISCKPFERLFDILINPEYLPAMKRRRSSDPQGDTAMHLGSAMDELMRHQPTLKTDATKAIIKLLKKLCAMGQDKTIIAFHPTDKVKTSKALKTDSSQTTTSPLATTNNEDPLSEDEMEEDYRSVLIRKSDSKQSAADSSETISSRITDERKFVPVVDYLLNVTKFLDNILSNNGTDDHCVEFVQLGGLEPLYNLLNMPNFPLEFPLMPACQSISQVCKSIAMLTQDRQVFREGLKQLDTTIDRLEELYKAANTNGSVLLHELASTEYPLEALYNCECTPLVHAMSATHAYINIFVFICRGAQSDIRNMSIMQWSSELGQSVLEKLSDLYTKLVWESSCLLTLCTPSADENLGFAEDDMQKLLSNTSMKEENISGGKKLNQLSLLKWLLTSSSHLGRALAELFGLLSLQSVGTQNPRIRRHPHTLNQVRPTLPARKIASMLTKLLVQGLTWECPAEIIVPRLRLTFYICSVGFSSPMLFDNVKNPYHLMLQQFEHAGGLEALFKRFHWVLDEYINNRTIEEIKTAVGISDFLEGWLDLINHMVNTELTFESAYALPSTLTTQDFTPFDVTQFLARMHMYAFEAVMLLWKHDIIMNPENHNIAEKLLSILCLIIKGEKQLKEKFVLQNKLKEKIDKSGSLASSVLSAIQKTPAPTTFQVYQDDVNETYLQQFIDMGFPSQHARDALVNTQNNFEVATEYLLTTPYHPASSASSSATTASTARASTSTASSGITETATSATSTARPTALVGTSTSMDVDLSEEDMMFQAIAMSLGQNSNSNASTSKSSALTKIKHDDTTTKEPDIPDITIEDIEKFTSTIDSYTNKILDGCLLLLDFVPSTVHTVCDLLLAVSTRNGLRWRNDTLHELVNQIQQCVTGITKKLEGETNVESSLMILCESREANQLSIRLHLYLLLFQDMENTCAYVLQESNCSSLMVELLAKITCVLKQSKEKVGSDVDIKTPPVTAPLILIFEYYEKAALFYKRKKNQVCSHVWKWFDDRSGRWCNYSTSNNTSIDTAYHAGENTVKFAAGRRRYMVFFKSLVQINEDTGNRRPIMLDIMQDKTANPSKSVKGIIIESAKESDILKSTSEKATGSKSMKRKLESSDKQKMDIDFENNLEGAQNNSILMITGLTNDVVEQIVRHTTDLLGIPVNGDSLNAIFRIMLRVTRDFSMACYFAQRNGVEFLLNLKDCSSFSGALPLVTLLLRHIVEDEETMKHAVERAVSIASNNGIPNMLCGVGQNSLGAKELHYLLRSLGSIACRDSALYKATTLKIFRLALPNARRGNLDETIPPNFSQIVKVPHEFKSIGLNGNIKHHFIMENFIHLLLKTLVERHFTEIEDSQNNPASNTAEKKTDKKKTTDGKLQQSYTPQSTLVRRLTGEHIDEEDIANASSSLVETKLSSTSENITATKKDKPFISESVIIRLLTELAKSYAAVAQLIVNYSYHSGDSSSISTRIVEGPILAFIFDHLLSHTIKDTSTTTSDPPKETKASTISTLSRSFLSVLGAYWHNTEVQNIFVMELKAALSRALQFPECKEKHTRLQAIFNLITSMIESAAPISFTSSPPSQNTSFIKVLIKRGLIADLARSTHSLDLSSHNLVTTVNVMLKPLEKLSNLANSQSLHKPAGGAATKGENTPLHPLLDETHPNENDMGLSADENNVTSATNEDNDSTHEISNLTDIVEVMLNDRHDEANRVLAETMISQQGNRADADVEEHIYVQANVVSRSDSSSESEHSSDHMGGGGDGAHAEPTLDELCQCDDDDEPLNAVAEDHSQSNDEDNNEEDEALYSLTNDTGVLVGDMDREEFRYTMTGAEETEDPHEDDVIEGEDDDDDDDSDDDDVDDVNDDDDDDEGSEMDADDTMATAETIIIGEHDDDDDATDVLDIPFTELDNNDTMEVLFPRRSFTVRLPQASTESNTNTTNQAVSTILSHPLLTRSTDQTSRTAANQRAARNRTSRAERGFIRAQGNTLHIHGNANTFARVLNGDNINFPDFTQGNDDAFFDIFGDNTTSPSGLLNAIPSPLSRWAFESRLLDGSSVHDCVNKIKPEIIMHLEKLQLQELKEKVSEEKRKKEESDKKKKKQEDKSTPATTSTAATSDIDAVTTTSVLDIVTDQLSTQIEVDTMEVSPAISNNPSIGNVTATTVTATQGITISENTPASVTSMPRGRSNRNTGVVGTTLWRPSTESSSNRSINHPNTPSRYITPYNPLPDVAPNAPERDLPRLPAEALNTTAAGVDTPLTGFSSDQLRSQSSDIASLLGVANINRDSVLQTPVDLPWLNQFRNNLGGLTGELGFTPNNIRGNAGSILSTVNTPNAELPSVAQILATPTDIPSLQQLRSSSLFAQNSTPRIPYNLPPLLRNNAPHVPSPLTNVERTTHEDEDAPPVTGRESALATDLAAAIMSQLVTSSPTPAIGTNTSTVDVGSELINSTEEMQSNVTRTQQLAAVTTMMSSSDVSTAGITTTAAVAGAVMSSSMLGATAAAASNSLDGATGSSVLRAAEQIQRELEHLGIPEGVDPSFLAALPDSIREEVLREQFGIRIQSTTARSTAGANLDEPAESNEEPREVSPEFLAALPPEVQQEVLEQQRLEQARYVAAQQRPEQPVDPADFVRNLNPSLRRQVLADLDDTVLAVLPPELTNEAQGLRREVELRQLQRNAERDFTRSANFSQIFRQSGFRSRTQGGGGVQLARIYPRGQMSSWKVTDGNSSLGIANKKVGRQLLDPEGLTCILVLLFLNDNTLNASRLHRILRNLSYHDPTKQWIIYALISILRRSSSNQQDSNFKTYTNCDSTNALCEEMMPSESGIQQRQQQSNTCWLSRTLNLAFGGCVNIFQLQKVGRKPSDSFVSVHQQACLDVCKQTLEALSFLAKNFPASFAPVLESEKSSEEVAGPSSYTVEDNHQSEFWDILVHLNALSGVSGGYKGKVLNKSLHEFPKISSTSVFVTSPLGQILSMLSHPVVKQSSTLTDKLLRLLAVISMSLPERPKHLQAQVVDFFHESSPDARPPDNDVMLPDIPHPIHTVTFANNNQVMGQDRAVSFFESPRDDIGDDEDTMNTGDAGGVACSETNSITSSLYVETPEITPQEQITLPSEMRHLRHVTDGTGSVLSGLSGGTVAQSETSGVNADHINVDRLLDSMDVDQQSRDTSETSSTDRRSSPTLSIAHLSPVKEPSILIGQLRMAVNVLTKGTCSDEGLEDATTLLLQLSRTEPMTRDSILDLLVMGAQETAYLLRDEIKQLLVELKQYNAMHSTDKTLDSTGKVSKQASPMIINPASARSQPWRRRGNTRNLNSIRRNFFGGAGGTAQNGSSSRRNVPMPVVYDLHLPTMTALTAKRSCQSLLLRVLKVILQLREAARKSAKKPSVTSRSVGRPRTRGMQLIQRLHNGGGSLREVVAALEEDMEAMYELIDRFGSSISNDIESTNTVESATSANNSATSTHVTAMSANNSAGSSRNQIQNTSESGPSNDNEGASNSGANNEAGTGNDEPVKKEEAVVIPTFHKISHMMDLDDLWDILGKALIELAETSDTNAVLVLQPAVETFFFVHGAEKEEDEGKKNKASNDPPHQSASSSSVDGPPPSPHQPTSPGNAISPSYSRLNSQSSFILSLPQDTQKFLRFAETHRTVLNQILRQSSNPLSDGPFSVLVNHTRLLDFDVKRRYFRQQLEKQDKGHRREDMSVHIRREHVFEDSYRELHRRTPEEIKNRLYIVFDGEEGQDAGGLLREWYGIMAREMFNPNYALFTTSQGEKSTYLPNRNSHCNPNHLSYFKFAGRIVAKAIYDNKLIDSYFTRSFYKHILGKSVHYSDMEAEDYSFYQGLVYLLEHDIHDLGYELTYSAEVQVFGLNEVHDLKPNGRNITVTEETKREYVKLVCQEKMTGSIRQQIDGFLEGFYEIIPKRLISIFDEQELELLIAGLPTIDIEDLRANTEYHKYTENSLQIQWLWRALRSFEQADRAKFLQFVTGTSRVPLQGFATLEGMNGTQKFQIHRDDRSTERLPCAHTCFNQLDLPAYETYDKLHAQLLKAIQECPEGFGLA